MNELTETYVKAVELNRKIITNAQIAQQSIFDMCVGLKTMRDEKLYKELNYQNFEDYCENEVGFSRQQAKKYIQILENVNTCLHFPEIGVSKLYLLSTLTEEEQTEITEKVDVESVSYRKLEKEVAEVKKSRDVLAEDNAALNDTLDQREESIKRLKDETQALKQTIEELENRPLVVEPEDNSSYRLNDKKLEETIRALERDNIEKTEELTNQFEMMNNTTRQILTEEKEKALAELKAEYDAKFAELKSVQQTGTSEESDKEVFKAYLTTACDSFSRLIEYANKKPNVLYFNKIRELMQKLSEKITEVN